MDGDVSQPDQTTPPEPHVVRPRGPLSGYRVLSLEHYLAGNHGTWLMSMFGAEVIKIERPGAGDTLRGVGPFLQGEHARRSGGEVRVMGNKQSVALDLATPEG